MWNELLSCDSEKGESCRKQYEKSVEAMQERLVFEEPCMENPQSLENWTKYLDFEEEASRNQPTRIKCLFERAIAAIPFDESLWQRYLVFLVNYLLTSIDDSFKCQIDCNCCLQAGN